MRDVTGLVILCGGCETFPGDMLGVISEVEMLIVVEDTAMTKEVCVWTEEVMASGTVVISEGDVKFTVDSETDQRYKCACVHICINTHTHPSKLS